MGSIDEFPGRPKPWRARYYGPDGRQHCRYFARKHDAEVWITTEEAAKIRQTWIDPGQGRRRFSDWADEWWQSWSTQRHRSPAALQITESHLRLHIKPKLGGYQLRAIDPQLVRRWQSDLEARRSWKFVMDCRSVLYRILQAAEDYGLIAVNPVRKVEPPRRRLDPDVVFGNVKPRVFSPEDFGRLLAASRPFYRDHFIVHVSTGLRCGELLGLHAYRVNLPMRRIEVVDVRYDAGKFGRGYKNYPKSDAAIRPVPLPATALAAIQRRIVGCPPDGIVFCGPGGSNGVRRGERSKLSITNYRRALKLAGTKASLTHLQLKGPYDLRHTFATWLEDARIPNRVIDELMGHERRGGRDGGSEVGTRYRHTTPELLAQVAEAVEERLAVALRSMPDMDQAWTRDDESPTD